MMMLLRLMIMLESLIGKFMLSTFHRGYVINYDFPKKDLIKFISNLFNNPSQFYNSLYISIILTHVNFNDSYLNLYLNKLIYLSKNGHQGPLMKEVCSFKVSANPYYYNLAKKLIIIND